MNACGAVVIYAIDAHHPPSMQVGKASGAVPADYGLTPEVFFKRLYVGREKVERDLRDSLSSIARPLVLVGARGSGKTSTSHRVLRDLGELGWTTVTVDLTEEYERGKMDQLDVSALREHVRMLLVNALKLCFFPSTTDSWKLYSFLLLQANMPGCRFLPAFHPLTKACVEGLRLFEQMLTASAEDFPSWLDSGEAERNAHVRRLVDHGIVPNLTVECLIVAGRQLLNIGHLLIFVDNVDKLRSIAHQAACFNLVEDLEQLLGPETHFLICVREENVTRATDDAQVPRDDEVQAPHNRAYTIPCVNMPDFTSELLDIILKTRLAYVGDPAIRSGNGSAAAELAAIERGMLSEYVNERMIELANDNARDALYAHVSFLKFISALAEAGVVTVAELGPYDYETLFYAWLVRKGEEANLFIYDLVDELIQWRREPARLGCMLNHLLLVVIAKQQDAFERQYGSRFGYATLGKVLQALEKLGWQREMILESLSHLYSQGGWAGHMVEFKTPLRRPGSTEVDTLARISITRRGKLLCNAVTLRLTYLVECLLKHQGTTSMTPHLWPREAIKQALECVCDIADMHCAGLLQLRAPLRKEYGGRWLGKYLDEYTIGGELQVDRLIASHVRHCNRIAPDAQTAGVWESGYVALRDEYRRRVRAITENKDLPESSLRKSVNFTVYGGTS